MTVGETESSGSSVAPFAALVGEEIIDLIFELAPTKVASRIAKALDHYTKALCLNGVDDEMGAIRCIAAEEELVVAIFEWLKLNASEVPHHGDFICKTKNHRIKLAFYPVLSQFQFVLSGMLEQGITLDGLEDVLRWHVSAGRVDNQIKLQIADEQGKPLIQFNPLSIAVSWMDRPDAEVIEELFKDFEKIVKDQRGMTVREFVTARADYRNKLLYAEDAGFFTMDETLEVLIRDLFSTTIRDLLWCLAVLLSDAPATPEWGLVSQFIALYRRVLTQAKVL